MVPSTFSRLKAARCLPVVLAALIFAGCGTHTPDQSTAYMQGTAQADSAFYLQQMQQSSDDTRINWQLLAIRALVKEGKTGQAVELFNQLPQELNDAQRREKTLLAVEIKLAQKDFAGAQNLLAKITPADLEQNQQARYWQAKIDASQGRPSIDLLRALIAQEPLLGAKEKQQNIDATWQALSSMTQEQANTLVINADENILQGWLDLQRVWFDNRNDPDMMKAGIADWQKRYPNNPGAKMLPTQLVNVKAFKPASTNKIALLLPLNGQAAVSAPANPSAELKIYDTSSQPLSQILSQVQQDGASIVVGPLLKNNVEELLKSNTPLNVLALNQPENIENRVNICYFALSPEDEARDAARHIRDQGKQAPLVLIPRSSLGDRVANAFAQEWQKLGGGTVLQQKFGSTSELRAGVNGGSGIALTGSPITLRATTDSGMTTNNPTLQTTPTDDQFTNNGGRVDAVYIVATPGEIAFIKPMIAMRNGSQSGATLYASSRSAQGTAGPDFRLEMEGLQYSEIPMLAGGNLPLMQQALSAVNNDYSLARMYAMGVDAWSLANHFSQMRQVQGFEINGNTGSLTANPDCVINRKLSWLQYQQGQVVPAS
ncbi:penicillin-binding protein activator [Escherichia coli]|uniref:penicillin-binding protein activator n=1 Tax=Escherichia coli TaxID=562 RepID=UPI002B9FA94B|nr:penicillin-binding protein activator [Escherichia coli]MEB3545006.1 penicillin-binding protein activator [Escherichia coli]